MKRRDFLQYAVTASAGLAAVKSLLPSPTFAAAKISAKDIMKDGQPATISNYCSTQPNKACPDYNTKPGHCETCQFFNKDNSLTTFKGGKYAHCQLLGDPSKPQFVSVKGWCSTYLKKP